MSNPISDWIEEYPTAIFNDKYISNQLYSDTQKLLRSVREAKPNQAGEYGYPIADIVEDFQNDFLQLTCAGWMHDLEYFLNRCPIADHPTVELFMQALVTGSTVPPTPKAFFKALCEEGWERPGAIYEWFDRTRRPRLTDWEPAMKLEGLTEAELAEETENLADIFGKNNIPSDLLTDCWDT